MDASAYVGRTIGAWQLRRLLGEGAFGGVFEAEDVREPGRLGAVKVLRPELSLQPDIRQRFLNEATAASRAEHDNIVRILDQGNTPDGVCYLVMELVRGVTLTQLLRGGPLSPSRAIHIAVQIAGALHAAHAQRVVHRDLKPDNIFITTQGHNPDFVKVLDFGVAKLRGDGDDKMTATGMIIGTAAYMAPEQWMGRSDLDGRADIYALGVILHECLAGQRPFQADNQFAWMKLHMDGVPPPSLEPRGVAAPLSRLVQRMLARRAEERPQSMGEVVRELQALLHSGAAQTQLASGAQAPTQVAPTPGYGTPVYGQTPGYGTPAYTPTPGYGTPAYTPGQGTQAYAPGTQAAPVYAPTPGYGTAAYAPPVPFFERPGMKALGQFLLGAAAVVIYLVMNWKDTLRWFQQLRGAGP